MRVSKAMVALGLLAGAVGAKRSSSSSSSGSSSGGSSSSSSELHSASDGRHHGHGSHEHHQHGSHHHASSSSSSEGRHHLHHRGGEVDGPSSAWEKVTGVFKHSGSSSSSSSDSSSRSGSSSSSVSGSEVSGGFQAGPQEKSAIPEEEKSLTLGDLEGVAWVAKGWIGATGVKGMKPDPFGDERLVKVNAGNIYFPGGRSGRSGPYKVGSERTLPLEAGNLGFRMTPEGNLAVEFNYKKWSEIIYERTPWDKVDLAAFKLEDDGPPSWLFWGAGAGAVTASLLWLRRDVRRGRAVTRAKFVALPVKPADVKEAPEVVVEAQEK